jgi:serpin B
MTLNGAQGTTFDQMRDMLGFGTMSLAEINQGYQDLLGLLTELDPLVQFGVGNSVWTQEGFPINADFLDRSQSYFDAEVQAMDFQHPDALGLINGWVVEKTNGKIKELLQEIDPVTVSLFLNATYFEGTWTHRFPKAKTTQANFTAEDGTQGTVPLMELSDTFLYGETDLFHVVDLPYGAGAFSMTVVLPKIGHSVEDVLSSLTSASWAQMLATLHGTDGTVYLPKFSLEWKGTLNQTLRRMGMVDAFTPGLADFSSLSDVPGLFVDEVLQKTFVDVNEDGTEAAAATSVDIQFKSAALFRADRPFLFFIGERLSNTILFAGAFMEPPGS